jgi:hypothetical protein
LVGSFKEAAVSSPNANDLVIPSELASQREALLGRLDAEIASAKGPVQPLLRVLAQFIRSTDQEAPLGMQIVTQLQLKRDQPGVVATFMKAMEAGKLTQPPPVQLLAEAQQFLRNYLAFLNDWVAKNGGDASAEAAARVEAATKTIAAFADAFVSAAAAPAQPADFLGNVDAPVAGRSQGDERKRPEELKNWVNPALGKVTNR